MEMLNPRISSDTLFMLWSYDESVIDVESNPQVKFCSDGNLPNFEEIRGLYNMKQRL